MKNIIAICLVGLMMTSCKTSYLKQSTNVSNVKKSYNNILVVSKSKDKTTRIKGESQMVKDLAARGVRASSSIDVIQTESFSKELTEEDLQNLRNDLVANGYDAILITTLINAEQYQDVIPGGANTAYMPVRYGRFGRYYSYYPATYWEPDRIETGVEYTVESVLYDLTVNQADNLQWVGRFQLRNPSDLVRTIEKYSQELADELLAQSVNPN